MDHRFFGRPKNLWSIYKKMKQRGKPFEEIYDLLAVRVLVNSIPECYHVLGIIHHKWTPRSEEHTSELQSRLHLVCRLLLEKKKKKEPKQKDSTTENQTSSAPPTDKARSG